MRFDLLIKGGVTIDDAGGLSGRHDVAISRGRIAAVEPGIPADAAFQIVDATDLYVTPGLIDTRISTTGPPSGGLNPTRSAPERA